MYIHFTGYVLKDGRFSDVDIIYTLSTESSFFYEMFDSYWTWFSRITPYSPKTCNMFLMGDPIHYIYVDRMYTSLLFQRSPYKRVQYPKEHLGYTDYDHLLKHWN